MTQVNGKPMYTHAICMRDGNHYMVEVSHTHNERKVARQLRRNGYTPVCASTSLQECINAWSRLEKSGHIRSPLRMP